LAGLYIHIPFCKQACHYCNFHFSTNQSRIPELVECLVIELKQKTQFLANQPIHTIYFGGGTPSILTQDQLTKILTTVSEHYQLVPEPEITLEANPDDVNPSSISSWAESGINRISLGIQSLHEDDLTFMNRSHSSQDCIESLDRLLAANAFEISADLIYGFNGLTQEKLLHNLHRLAEKPIQHMSCYAMTIEAKTAFHHQLHKGTLQEMQDEEVGGQFNTIHSVLATFGFDHYEISNYCRDEKYATHNTNYWKGNQYLGIGPSAHSFDGSRRYWNASNNAAYINAIQQNHSITEEETLTTKDKYNEYILTGLRTKWGVNTTIIKRFGKSFIRGFQLESKNYLEGGQLLMEGESVVIADGYWTIADRISSDLFMI